MHICLYVYTHICTHAHLHTHVRTHVYMHTRVCLRMCACAHTCVCVICMCPWNFLLQETVIVCATKSKIEGLMGEETR